MAELAKLTPRSAFRGLLAPTGSMRPAGVNVEEVIDIQICTIIVRKGAEFALAAAVNAHFGVELPRSQKGVTKDGHSFLCIGPRTWLAIREARTGSLVQELWQTIGDHAAVADQSDGYAVLRISGGNAWAVFEKGLGIDLDPRIFGPDSVASTTCSHIGVTIWRTDATSTYHVALFRSFAGSFWHWLEESAAEFGLSAGALLERN
jgi:heterotetrameric sarcosine oxidase gamma subunit